MAQLAEGVRDAQSRVTAVEMHVASQRRNAIDPPIYLIHACRTFHAEIDYFFFISVAP
jgi:hypothetical protein